MTEEAASRRDAVEAAIASARLAGVDVAAETLAMTDAYVAGEIDADALMQHALSLWGPHEKGPPG